MQSGISWQEERAMLEETVSGHAASNGKLLGNPSGSILLATAGHDVFSGTVESGPYCRIALLQAGGGRLRQCGADVDLDAQWRPGAVSMLLPRRTYHYEAPATQFLGLAIDLQRYGGPIGPIAGLCLEDAARGLHHDPLVASVMHALYAEAETHGMSSAFFEHGVELIFTRLAEIGGYTQRPWQPSALTIAQLSRLGEFIYHNLARDLTVSDLAREVGRDRTGFARAFRLATGSTPYEYLTQRRMHAAMALLRQGENVTSVAAAVGYANPSKFAVAFRRVAGMSPREWVTSRSFALQLGEK